MTNFLQEPVEVIMTPEEEYLDWYTLNYGDPTDEELDLLYEEVWGQ